MNREKKQNKEFMGLDRNRKYLWYLPMVPMVPTCLKQHVSLSIKVIGIFGECVCFLLTNLIAKGMLYYENSVLRANDTLEWIILTRKNIIVFVFIYVYPRKALVRGVY